MKKWNRLAISKVVFNDNSRGLRRLKTFKRIIRCVLLSSWAYWIAFKGKITKKILSLLRLKEKSRNKRGYCRSKRRKEETSWLPIYYLIIIATEWPRFWHLLIARVRGRNRKLILKSTNKTCQQSCQSWKEIDQAHCHQQLNVKEMNW